MRLRLVKTVGFLALALCIAASTGCSTVTRIQISAPVPFVTTPPGVVKAMLKLADVTGSDIVYDLGSGDGRIVIAATRDFGARAVGVEIDPKLVQESERNAENAGVSSRVRFLQQDLFQADITEATVVTLFLLPGVNAILAPKLLKELRPGTRIVSYWYDMGEWQPDKTIRVDTLGVYYWVVPAHVDGMWTLNIPTAEGIGSQILSFRQAFQKISGSVRLNGRKLDLRDPRIDGEHLSFTASGTVGGELVLMRFSGRVQGGQAAGVVEVKGGTFSGSHQWVAQRSAK
jgi:SAM-dependent methyltransferase